MIDVPSVLAELVHNKTQISDMVNWYDFGVAYPNSYVLKFFQLLMGSKNDKFCFSSLSFSMLLAIHFLISSTQPSIRQIQSS